MRKSILFVINPIAGGGEKPRLVEHALQGWQKDIDVSVAIYKTEGKEDVSKIEQKIRSAQPETIVTVGGDGTFLLGAKICKEQGIKLGYIPAGSANGMAAELNIPQNIDQALDVINKGKTQHCDMLQFNGDKLGVHISDIGLNAALVESFEESENRGFLAYASGLAEQLSKLKTFKLRLNCNGSYEEHQCLMAAFANARYYGSGAAINSLGKLDDGQFEVCLLHDIGLTELARHFFDIVNENSPHLTIKQCKTLEIELDEEVPFQIDGELMAPAKSLKVEVLPHCLRVIIP